MTILEQKKQNEQNGADVWNYTLNDMDGVTMKAREEAARLEAEARKLGQSKKDKSSEDIRAEADKLQGETVQVLAPVSAIYAETSSRMADKKADAPENKPILQRRNNAGEVMNSLSHTQSTLGQLSAEASNPPHPAPKGHKAPLDEPEPS